ALLEFGIGFDADFGHVEAQVFVLGTGAQAHHGLEDRPDNQADHEDKDANDEDREKLDADIGVGVGEHHRDRAPDAGKEMDRDGADNVVDLEAVEHRHREHHDDTTHGADQRSSSQTRRERFGRD